MMGKSEIEAALTQVLSSLIAARIDAGSNDVFREVVGPIEKQVCQIAHEHTRRNLVHTAKVLGISRMTARGKLYGKRASLGTIPPAPERKPPELEFNCMGNSYRGNSKLLQIHRQSVTDPRVTEFVAQRACTSSDDMNAWAQDVCERRKSLLEMTPDGLLDQWQWMLCDEDYDGFIKKDDLPPVFSKETLGAYDVGVHWDSVSLNVEIP